jgi:hypothetical protein
MAAGAAGVGALAPQANAEIVFYPANAVLSRFNLTNYALDINHDGTRDFYFYANWERDGFPADSHACTWPLPPVMPLLGFLEAPGLYRRVSASIGS